MEHADTRLQLVLQVNVRSRKKGVNSGSFRRAHSLKTSIYVRLSCASKSADGHWLVATSNFVSDIRLKPTDTQPASAGALDHHYAVL